MKKSMNSLIARGFDKETCIPAFLKCEGKQVVRISEHGYAVKDLKTGVVQLRSRFEWGSRYEWR